MQSIDIQIIFPDPEFKHPSLVLDGTRYEEGDKLNDHGLTGRTITERFLRVVVLLALRRHLNSKGGWTTADEIAAFVDTSSSPGGTKKFLERWLWGYDEDDLRLTSPDDLPATHLIQYWPRERVKGIPGGWRGGKSSGPYRLGPPSRHVTLNAPQCWDYLLDRRPRPPLAEPRAILESGRNKANRGLFVEARLEFLRALKALHVRHHEDASSTQLLGDMAEAWELLSNVEMELQRSEAAIRGAKKANHLYGEIEDPEGVAHTLQIQAHAIGQLDKQDRARHFAQQALRALDRCREELRRGYHRAQYAAVLGKYQSRLGGEKRAENKLERAIQLSLEHGRLDKAIQRSLRLARHYMRRKKWDRVRAQLVEAERHSAELNVPQTALYLRTRARFLAQVDRTNQARQWVERCIEFAQRNKLPNLIGRVLPLLNLR